ncbi:MAG: hypothetical protein QXL74_05650 [Candidatus Bathyarchaeia archaeon]
MLQAGGGSSKSFSSVIKRKIKNFFTSAPSLNISREREDELIEKIAQLIHKYELEDPAMLFMAGLQPIAPIVVPYALFPISPILRTLGIKTEEYIALLSKGENIKRIIERLEELQRQE